ncbi:MAG TPA: carboxymuconolactone decarboxylase family protein [Candidatus Methylomirabilis sp.]|jgi:alkylhydroperoxidase/carboxymuconolactone decarboxylase family protein YurZ
MPGKPPQAYQDFVKRFPELGEAWRLLHEGEAAGPLDLKTLRLVKLGIAIGAKQRGAVSSAVRKGLGAGLTPRELEQVVACAASTIGLPAAVASYGWVREAVEKSERP